MYKPRSGIGGAEAVAAGDRGVVDGRGSVAVAAVPKADGWMCDMAR